MKPRNAHFSSRWYKKERRAASITTWNGINRAREHKKVWWWLFICSRLERRRKRRTHHRLFEQIFTAWGGVKRGRRAVSLISLHIIFMQSPEKKNSLEINPKTRGTVGSLLFSTLYHRLGPVYVFVSPHSRASPLCFWRSFIHYFIMVRGLREEEEEDEKLHATVQRKQKGNTEQTEKS